MQKCRLPTLMAVCVAPFQTRPPPQRAYGQTARDDWTFRCIHLSCGITARHSASTSPSPPSEGDSGGAGNIVDSRFDGAFLGGAAASNGTWRIEGDGIWAGFGGDRAEPPNFTVDSQHHLRTRHARPQDCSRPVPDRRRAASRSQIRHQVRRVTRVSRTPGVWDSSRGR